MEAGVFGAKCPSFRRRQKQAEKIERLELEQRVAHERIGRLTIENEFF